MPSAGAVKSRKRSKTSVEKNNHNSSAASTSSSSSKRNAKRAKTNQDHEEDEDSPQEVERRIKFGRMLAVSNKKTRAKGKTTDRYLSKMTT